MKGRVSSKACSATPDNMLSYEKEIPPTSSHTVKTNHTKENEGVHAAPKDESKQGDASFVHGLFA